MLISAGRDILELERLVPSEGHDHLGLVVAFAIGDQDSRTTNSAYESFVKGAISEKYKVLLVNNFSLSNQPVGYPETCKEYRFNYSDLVDAINIPWLSSPIGEENPGWATVPVGQKEQALTLLSTLIPQYDFIIMGTGDSQGKHKQGLWNLKFLDERYFYPIDSIVDRFVLDCSFPIPNKIKDKTVTFAKFEEPFGVTPSLVMIDDKILGAVTFAQENMAGNKHTISINTSVSSHAKKGIHPGSIPPVAAVISNSLINSHKLVFGGITGIIQKEDIYVNKEIYDYASADHPEGKKKGWTIAIGSYAVVNTLAISLGVADVVHDIMPTMTATLGGVMSAIAGLIACDNEATEARLTASEKLLAIPPKMTGSLPLIQNTKSMPQLTSSPVTPKPVTLSKPDVETLPVNIVSTVSAFSTDKMLARATQEYEAVRNRWLEYELDVVKFIEAPLMRDLSCKETADFFTCMHRTQMLFDTAEFSTPEHIQQISESVTQMVVAFERAEAHALQICADFLPADKKKDFMLASQFMAVAHNEGASISERSTALEQGRKLLGKTVITPKTVYGAIEGHLKAIESRSTGQLVSA